MRHRKLPISSPLRRVRCAALLRSTMLLAAVAFVASSSAGCGLLDSGSQSNAVNDTCTKNLDELYSLATSPQACTTDTQCTVAGSYCGDGDVCTWDCFQDSDCGVGNSCDCSGQCTGEIADAPDAGVSGPTCERDEAILLALRESGGARSCRFDDECPSGSRCDGKSNTCTWDCLTGGAAPGSVDAGSEPQFTCSPGVACDCSGRCDNGSSEPTGPRLDAPLSISFEPANVDVAFGTPWTQRRVVVTLSRKPGATDTSNLVVRAGTGLSVGCSMTGAASWYSDRCDLRNFTFTAIGQVELAKGNIWLRRDSGTADKTWTANVEADNIPGGVRVITVRELPEPPVVVPSGQDGVYDGYLELAETGMSVWQGGGGGGNDSWPPRQNQWLRVTRLANATPVRVPVRAWFNNGVLQFYDPQHLLSAHGGLRTVATGLSVGPAGAQASGSTWFVDRAESELWAAGGESRTPLYAYVVNRSVDPNTGVLSGALRLGTNTGYNWRWNFTMVRSGDGRACTDDSRCDAGASCAPGLGLCVVGPTLSSSAEVTSTRLADWASGEARWIAEAGKAFGGAANVAQIVCAHTHGTYGGLLPVSGDQACDGGDTPLGVELAHLEDRRRWDPTLPELTSDALLAACIEELNATPAPPGGLARERGTCFSALPFYGAYRKLRYDTSSNGKRELAHMLQQWIGLHSFIVGEGRRQHALAAAVPEQINGGESEVADVALAALLDQMERGWNLVLDTDLDGSVLRNPDYRSQTGGLDTDHNVGLPVHMLEGLETHMQLIEAYLAEQDQDLYGSCNQSSRDAAVERAARALRYVQLVLAKATETYIAASAKQGCGYGPPSENACASGYTCQHRSTSTRGICLDSAGDFQAVTLPWQAQWDNAIALVKTVRARLIQRLSDVRQCVSEIDRTADQVPLYFGDPVGDTERFFASSDYLMRGWAEPAVAAAVAALDGARQSWQQQRQSKIQQVLNDNDADRRLEQLATTYGSTIVNACGIEQVDAARAFQLVGYGPGQQSPLTCFLNSTDPECTAVDDHANDIYDLIDDRTVQFSLCKANELNRKLLVIKNQIQESRDPQATDYRPCRGTACTELPADADPRVTPPGYDYLAVLDALSGLQSAPASFATATFDRSARTFSWAGASAAPSVDTLYSVLLAVNAIIPPVVLERAEQQCARFSFGGEVLKLPNPDTVFPNRTRKSMAHCYRGTLGEAMLGTQGANVSVAIAIEEWDSLDRRYSDAVKFCRESAQDNAQIREMWRAHDAYMVAQIKAKAQASRWSSALGSIAQSLSMGPAGVINVTGALADQSSIDVSSDMSIRDIDFRAKLRLVEDRQQVKKCMFDAGQMRQGMNAAALRIDQAFILADASLVRFGNILRNVHQQLIEGNVVVERERGRRVTGIAHHYWLNEYVDRFKRDFDWAKRLTMLAAKAVEFETQQSLGLIDDVVKADHPDQLVAVIQRLKQLQLSRTINSRRPEDATLVVSLRDELMRIGSNEDAPAGERQWSALKRFQSRMWSPEYAIYNDEGVYLGQGLRFNLAPIGALELRCAERLWRVSATVQGDFADERSPARTLFLIRDNSFQSQWCDGRGDGGTFQTGSLQPSSSLFPDDERGGREAAQLKSYSAMLQPWFNVARSQFYDRGYANGASDELAGRGMYGNYTLLFPWKGLLEDGFDIEKVEDILLRFDYLSVDNITGL